MSTNYYEGWTSCLTLASDPATLGGWTVKHEKIALPPPSFASPPPLGAHGGGGAQQRRQLMHSTLCCTASTSPCPPACALGRSHPLARTCLRTCGGTDAPGGLRVPACLEGGRWTPNVGVSIDVAVLRAERAAVCLSRAAAAPVSKPPTCATNLLCYATYVLCVLSCCIISLFLILTLS